MCFSNLPIEFDEQGNPYLADEAEDVERPDGGSGDEAPTEADSPIEEDPEEAYAEIVASVPDRVRESLAGEGADDRPPEDAGGGSPDGCADDRPLEGTTDGDPGDGRESARGD